jgi:acetyl esterase
MVDIPWNSAGGEMTLAEAREADLASIVAGRGQPPPVGAVTDLTLPGPAGELPARVYRPDGEPPFPVLVYFYGGGWTLGNLETCDALCRALTNAARCVTVSVQYRLAPEHPFPAAVEDSHAGFAWVAGHAAELGVDPARVAVGGDSAGGNLAAALCLLARDRGGPSPRHQLLVYPNTDHAWDPEALRAFEDPLLFNRWSVAWYWKHYLADERDGSNPLASPLRAASLAGLPGATVITAEYDPLRDQGERYAERLREEGVKVELRRYDGMAHGFFGMFAAFALGRDAVAYAAQRLVRELG